MPITKTAKRALRGSKRKELVNKKIRKNLEVAVRNARSIKNLESVKRAISLSDRAFKKKLIKKNKAARIKSALSKLLKAPSKAATKLTAKKKTKSSKK